MASRKKGKIEPDERAGRSFERLSFSIFQKLLRNPEYESVQHDVKLPGIDGARQIDLLLQSESFGVKLSTVIECKDYNKKLSVGVVDAFHSKIQDVKANKGIIISKRGFSSTAISKAKRLGIDLFTASEAMNDEWSIDLNIPVIFTEITPVNLGVKGTFMANSSCTLNLLTDKINGHNLHELVDLHWRKGSLGFDPSLREQEVTIPELQPPYVMKTSAGALIDVSIVELKVTLTTEVSYVKCSLDQLQGTQVLENIIDGNLQVFIDLSTMLNYFSNATRISAIEAQDLGGISITACMHPILNIGSFQGSVRKIA